MDIIEKSNTTLLSIEQNDPKLTHLIVVGRDYTTEHKVACFWLHEGADVSRLGNAIANNTHLESIDLRGSSEWTLDTNGRLTPSLFDGLQRNNTIESLSLHGGIGIDILYEIVAISSSVTNITLLESDLRGGVLSTALAQAIRNCPNLKDVLIHSCKIDDISLKEFALGIRGLSCLQSLEIINGSIDGTEGAKAIAALFQDPNCIITNLNLSSIRLSNESIQIIVDGLRGYAQLDKLERLNLSHNRVKSSSCESIINLLQDPSCNLTSLDIGHCGINNEPVTKIIKSLIGNTKLEHLGLSYNKVRMSGCESIIALLVHPNSHNPLLRQNTKSDCNVNKIELSGCGMDNMCAVFLAGSLEGNNKLTCLDLSDNEDITELGWSAFSILLSSNCSNHTLLSLGERNGSSEDFLPCNLASLLKLNRAVDMEPWFELDSEDDERNLKALPSVIDWFDRCASRLARNGDVEYRRIVNSTNARKLSAMFQFALAMPLEFVPSQSVMLRLHKEAKVQLKEKSLELERQIASKEAEIRSMIKAKKELDDEIKTKNETIKNWASDSVG